MRAINFFFEKHAGHKLNQAELYCLYVRTNKNFKKNLNYKLYTFFFFFYLAPNFFFKGIKKLQLNIR